MSAHRSRFALPARKVVAGVAALLVASTGLGWSTATPAGAQQAIGLPTFVGPDDPVPPEPAPFTVGDTMREMFEADLATGDGTDFWMDRLLERRGADPAGNQLLTRGRALFMATHNPNVIGFGGQVAYWDVINGQAGYTISLGDGGFDQVVAERVQQPSNWRGSYVNAATGLEVRVTKFITDNNVAVTNLAITNTADEPQTLPIRVDSPHATTPDGDELTDVVDARRGLTTLFPRLSGDGMTVDGSELAGEVTVDPGETVDTKVQMGFVTEEIEASRSEYDDIRDASPADAFTSHVRTYNEWWADNLPYIDVADDNIKKFIYYRWFIARFNILDADIPGNDFQFPVSIEGVLGFNNAIALTIPMFIDETKYFRDPLYSYGTWLSAGEQSENARYADNPGEPDNWNDSYLQYTTDAAWRAYQVHGGQPDILGNLAHYGESDVRSQLAFHDLAGNPNNDPNLLWYCCNFLNGNDADNPSFAFLNRGNERVESAYVYANAHATADVYELLDEDDQADEMRQIAGDVQDAILTRLWDPATQEFRHRDVQTDSLIPWKEINNYYPFTVGLVPDEDQFTDSLDLFGDPAQYPVFPFYTANQADKAAAQAVGRGGSNNFSQINSTVQFRLASSAIRNYETNETINAEWYEQLLYWNAWAHFIGGDTRWPDSNEFWFNWNPTTQTFGRSGIHHSQLGSSNWTIIEDVAGLQPRSDDKIELWPIDVDFDHFAVNNVRYHDVDLTVVWDDPGDDVDNYPGVPQGYSGYIDGERVFTVDSLVHTVYNPRTGRVTLPDRDGEVLFEADDDRHGGRRGGDDDDRGRGRLPDVSPADEVELTGDRVVDMFQNAGVDISDSDRGHGHGRDRDDRRNLALGATPSASFVDQSEETTAYGPTDTGAAVDGFTINMPFWGSAASGNAQDWYELDFGRRTTIDELDLYFFNDREVLGVPDQHRVTTPTNRYREPALYTVQVFRDGQWVEVRDQDKSPTYPRSNFNRVEFRPTSGERFRVLMTNREGFGTGLKEIQAFHDGRRPPRPDNEAPLVVVREDPNFQQPGQVRIEGIVEDDGLPNAELDTTWTTVSGPGQTLIDDQSAHNALVSFSEEGTYVLELTATDGDLTTTRQITVTAEDLSGGVNVAPRATPTCTNTSPWESCAAVNDGADPNGPPQYGTWPTNGNQQVELAWDEPVRVDSASMWFFQDVPPGASGGVQAPASWTVQWWDGTQFVDVTSPSGFGVALNQFNEASFDPVTTTRLRANLVARPNQEDAEGIGVREWQVFAERPESISEVHVRTDPGVVPTLPATVTKVFADGTRLEAPVRWQQVTADQLPDNAVVTVLGSVQDTTLFAEATIYVRPLVVEVDVTSVQEESIVTPPGVAPQLPPTVIVTYNDGSRESGIPVTWAAIDPAQYAVPGNTFTVTGVVEDTDIPAQARVRVLGGPAPP
ncbi:MAG: Ig-like domain-containing protein [Acidimicrobiales bacterium]